MYLTRFRFNTARRGTIELLRSPQRVHGAVMKAFADLSEYRPGDGPRILWRLDRDGEDTVLYIASPKVPDLTHVAEQAGWPSLGRTWDTAEYGRLLDRLAPGQRWGFRLTANPTHAVKLPPRGEAGAPAPGRSKRLGHVTVAQQEDWLRSRQESMGVQLSFDDGDAFRVTRRDLIRFKRDGSDVTLSIAQYDGVLEVRDAAALRRTLTCGVGPAKGYGCGMLTLAPV